MSNITDLSFLDSERKQVGSLLNEAMSTGDVVAEMSFQSRLSSIEEKISEIALTDRKVAEIALVFEGKPVLGQKSIDATFATKALSLFQEIISKIYASASSHGLDAARGKIHQSSISSLQITGLARGSFGFLLEESASDQSTIVPTNMRESVDKAIETFENLTQQDDGNFLLELDEINKRLFSSLQKFFNHLHTNEASFKTSLATRTDAHTFSDIERAHNRLSETRFETETLEWEGRLMGFAPQHRQIEFMPDDSTEMISGKFDWQFSQDYLERIESEGILLGSNVFLTVEVTRITKPTGAISTNYTVTKLEENPSIEQELAME